MKRIITCVLFVSINLSSQIKLQGKGGLSYPVDIDGYEVELYRYWKIGLNAGVNADIQLSKIFAVKPTITYQYIFFNDYTQEVIAGSKAISSDGNESHIINLGGELCIEDNSDGTTHPFLFLGGGYAIERPGKMNIAWKEFENPSRDIYTTEYQIQNRNYWYYSAGFGFGYSIADDLDIRTVISYFANKVKVPTQYKTYNSYWLLSCSLVYDILKL